MQQTLLGDVWWHWGWEILKTLHFSPYDHDLNHKLKHLLHRKLFTNREDILVAMWCKIALFKMSGVGVFCLFHFFHWTMDICRDYFKCWWLYAAFTLFLAKRKLLLLIEWLDLSAYFVTVFTFLSPFYNLNTLLHIPLFWLWTEFSQPFCLLTACYSC
jgi:hypothetical protein